MEHNKRNEDKGVKNGSHAFTRFYTGTLNKAWSSGSKRV